MAIRACCNTSFFIYVAMSTQHWTTCCIIVNFTAGVWSAVLQLQSSSRTPGHCEARLLDAVEVTTGPLGQGVANSVGLAIARNYLAARFNRPGFPLFDHTVYAVCSDGDLMEGRCPL